MTPNDTIAERVMFQIEVDSIIIQKFKTNPNRIWCLSGRL